MLSRMNIIALKNIKKNIIKAFHSLYDGMILEVVSDWRVYGWEFVNGGANLKSDLCAGHQVYLSNASPENPSFSC